MEIWARRTTANSGLCVGGLIADIKVNNHAVTNVVALNSSITGAQTAHTSQLFQARICGYNESSTSNISNAYAWDAMPILFNGSAPTLDEGNTTQDGASKSLTELRESAFWTGLGFSENVWDFAPLTAATPGWPVLK
jgi:hypothetical protein